MTTYAVLIVICGIIIYSYLANVLAKRTNIPAVLILLLSGIILRYVTEYFHIKTLNFNLILPALGTIGLIMIVFEGALELDYQPAKKQLIIKAFWAALVILTISCLLIAIGFWYMTGRDFNVCVLNAVPFGVISSAVAIPSVTDLTASKKEFIVFESSFSDILGIMFFNFMATNKEVELASFLHLGLETFEIIVIAALSCLALLYLLGQLTSGVKYVLIIAIMVLIYAIGRTWHLPSLVIVFAFGLFLKNVDLIKSNTFQKYFLYERYQSDMHQLHQISAESAFLLRTFFFIIFGFTIHVEEILDFQLIQNGLGIFIITFAVRYAILSLLLKTTPNPELYITPRGLISILLFYGIADHLKLFPYQSGLLLFTVLTTNLAMTFGLVRYKSFNQHSNT
jgi:hypothetical protein